MTNTTHTVDAAATMPSAPQRSTPTALRQHRVALLITVAIVALAAWAVVQLQGTTTTVNPPTSIRQAERAELQQQGITSYDQLPAVQRSQERHGVGTAPSREELRQMEQAELRRFRNRTLAEQSNVDPMTRQMERRTGSSPDQ